MPHKNRKKELAGHILPAVALSVVSGAVTGTVIVMFKFCAGHAVRASAAAYDMLAKNPIMIIAAVAALAVAALGFTLLYRVVPSARGGGIPTSVGILRGMLSFKWLTNAVSVFFASLATFLIGVPLGTEGPSVQIGTALGKGVSLGCAKKHKALERYIMTGGASAGFTVATGSPIAGIMFALEEAHQRISPLILLSTAAAVVSAKAVSDLLSPVFGVSTNLFEIHPQITLSAADFWIPVSVACIAGLASVLFLKYYKILNKLWTKKLSRIPAYIKILSVLLITLALGLVSDMFISTGHSLSDMLIEAPRAVHILLICLAVRSTVMILASSSGITGGMFLPILALGALVSSLMGSIFTMLGVDTAFYPLIVTLGITASVAGMMKMPVTAIVFGIEALSLSNNILPVIITASVTYLITEIFSVKSITEKVLESKLHHLHGDKKPNVYDTFVTVRNGSFAVGKQVRDILWPCDMIVLSIRYASDENTVTADLGETVIREGDVLHIRYPTFDIAATHSEISALVGEQEYIEEKIKKV